MFSETILFITIFWIIFHFILSSYYILIESIFIPEPCELTYGTTLLLSNAGISIGSILISRDSLGLFYWNTISSFIYSILFIFTQINEFHYLGFYMNDSELGCIYIFLSGLHFFHILFGILILGINSNSIYSIEILPIDTVSMDMYFIMDYYYWHIVEMVYIYIYITLYYYWICKYSLKFYISLYFVSLISIYLCSYFHNYLFNFLFTFLLSKTIYFTENCPYSSFIDL